MARISRRTSSSRRTSAQPRAYRGRHLKLVIKYMAAWPDNVPDIHEALEVGVPSRTQNDHELRCPQCNARCKLGLQSLSQHLEAKQRCAERMPANLVADIHSNAAVDGTEKPCIDQLHDALDSSEDPEKVWCPCCWKPFDRFEDLANHLYAKRACLTSVPEDTVRDLSHRVGWNIAGNADTPPPVKRPRSDNAPPVRFQPPARLQLRERLQQYEGPRDAEEHLVVQRALSVHRRHRTMVSPRRKT